jgi:hypothetical protein
LYLMPRIHTYQMVLNLFLSSLCSVKINSIEWLFELKECIYRIGFSCSFTVIVIVLR